MDFSNIVMLNAATDGAILSHDNVNQTVEQAIPISGDASLAVGQTQGGFMSGNMSILIIYTVIIGFMWMVVFRPQKKRAKQLKEMHEGIKTGDNVVTSGGLYGKIVDIGTNVYVLEFGMNKGIRIPVDKNDIVAVREPNLVAPKPEEESK